MDHIKLNPAVFFSILIIAAALITGGVYLSTKSSLANYLRIPSFQRPLTAAQLAAQQAAKTKKINACISGVKNSWGTTINLAASENLPVATYQKQEAQLIAKCQTNP
jgi:hypothetical protein